MELPDELQLHVFGFLSASDLCRSVEGVSRRWGWLARDDLLWRGLLVADCRSQVRARAIVNQRKRRPAGGYGSSSRSCFSGWKGLYRRWMAEERNWNVGRYRTAPTPPKKADGGAGPHHEGGCEFLDFDGRFVVSGGWDKGVKIFDVDACADVSSLLLTPTKTIQAAHEDGILSIRSVGDQFLSCSRRSIQLWDRDQGIRSGPEIKSAESFVFADIDQRQRIVVAGTSRGNVMAWIRKDDDGGDDAQRSPLSQSRSTPRTQWGKCMHMRAHTRRTRVVHFPKWGDGSRMVSAGYDGLVTLIDMESSFLAQEAKRRTSSPQELFTRENGTEHPHNQEEDVNEDSSTDSRGFNHGSSVVCLSSTEYGGFDAMVELWDVRMVPLASVTEDERDALYPPIGTFNLSSHQAPDNEGSYVSTLDCDDWKLIAGIGHQLFIWDRRRTDQILHSINVCNTNAEVWSVRVVGPHLVSGSSEGYVRIIDYSGTP